MSGTNHVSGGLLFTGIFASFWNINIFSDATLIALTIFGALLPDIDHRKSPIGRLFFPISRYLDTRFGHRTITHSLLFLLSCTLLCYLIQHLNISPHSELDSEPPPITIIFFFSALSHLILDMVTIKGIPLFYPFIKNPCVIPGNPNFRLESGSMRTEAIALLIFCSLLFTCRDLFANGFWTSYNSTFGTISHIHKESKSSNDYLLVAYQITHNGKPEQDTAILIQSTENTATLYKKGQILTLNQTDPTQHIIDVKPIHTHMPYQVQTLNKLYTQSDIAEIQAIFQTQIITGDIRSNRPFHYYTNGIPETKTQLKISNAYNTQIALITDSADIDTRQQLQQLNIQVKQDIVQWQQENKQWRTIKQQIDSLTQERHTNKQPYQLNNIESQIIALRAQLKSTTEPRYTPDPIKLSKVEYLLRKLKHPDAQTFHINIQYPIIPKQYQ